MRNDFGGERMLLCHVLREGTAACQVSPCIGGKKKGLEKYSGDSDGFSFLSVIEKMLRHYLSPWHRRKRGPSPGPRLEGEGSEARCGHSSQSPQGGGVILANVKGKEEEVATSFRGRLSHANPFAGLHEKATARVLLLSEDKKEKGK